MQATSTNARIAAAIVALVAWTGLGVQFAATYAGSGSVAETLWIVLRYFTVITNLAVALLLTAVAIGLRVGPHLLTGVTLAILLVGVVYGLLLRGLVELSGGALLADALLHKVVPVLTPLFWLVFAPKGHVRSRDPLLWALYPLGYFGYALVRGQVEGRYAYPFIDVAALGRPATLLNALLIALGFLAAGYAILWLDRRLAQNAMQTGV